MSTAIAPSPPVPADVPTLLSLNAGYVDTAGFLARAVAPKMGQILGTTVIVDNNQVQQTGLVKEIQDLDPLADKFRSFKWNAIEINGHDHAQCLDALRQAKEHKGQPTAIISHTIKGKGVSFMELDYHWHGKAPDAEQAARAIAEIEEKG